MHNRGDNTMFSQQYQFCCAKSLQHLVILVVTVFEWRLCVTRLVYCNRFIGKWGDNTKFFFAFLVVLFDYLSLIFCGETPMAYLHWLYLVTADFKPFPCWRHYLVINRTSSLVKTHDLTLMGFIERRQTLCSVSFVKVSLLLNFSQQSRCCQLYTMIGLTSCA